MLLLFSFLILLLCWFYFVFLVEFFCLLLVLGFFSENDWPLNKNPRTTGTVLHEGLYRIERIEYIKREENRIISVGRDLQ